MAKKKAAPVASPATTAKKHERKAKPKETDLIERGKQLVTQLFVQREGMEEAMARSIVDSMDADSINAMIAEANTTVIETGSTTPAVEPEKVFVDFLTIPELVADEEFARTAVECVAAGITKLNAEKEYKRLKPELYKKMKASGHMLVNCIGIEMEAYTGEASHLDETMLIEAGVDPAIVRKCWKKTPYDDVRFKMPKKEKTQ